MRGLSSLFMTLVVSAWTICFLGVMLHVYRTWLIVRRDGETQRTTEPPYTSPE
jgi:cbb3-type cytochrome oxidase subunit 3